MPQINKFTFAWVYSAHKGVELDHFNATRLGIFYAQGHRADKCDSTITVALGCTSGYILPTRPKCQLATARLFEND